MDYSTIRFERRENIGILSLNRPERLNVLNYDMFAELADCFTRLADDFKTRVIILRGEGRAFCSGMDANWLANQQSADVEDMGEVQRLYHKAHKKAADVIHGMRRAPQPLIAAVRGPAAGGGFCLTLACDVRIAAESARFNAAFVRVGGSGGDMGTTYFLPRLIGLSNASRYLFTGDFVDAPTALRIGLVSEVVPDVELEAAAIDMAERMLRLSPFGLRLTKEMLNMNAGAPTLETVTHHENSCQTLCLLTEDLKEGARAFLEKRAPVWKDR